MEAPSDMGPPDDTTHSWHSPITIPVHETDGDHLSAMSESSPLFPQTPETIPSSTSTESLLHALRDASSDPPLDQATPRLTPVVCIPNWTTSRGLPKLDPSLAHNQCEPLTTTVNEFELRMLEEIRTAQARHTQREPPRGQVVFDRMHCLDTLILEAVSLFMTPHHNAAFSFTLMTQTNDTATLSQLVLGYQPQVNVEEVIARALDMQDWKMPPTDVLVRAYIAAALNQWVFRAKLGHGWDLTDYRAQKMEEFIGRGQSHCSILYLSAQN